jgi:hypothetical protein
VAWQLSSDSDLHLIYDNIFDLVYEALAKMMYDEQTMF